MHSRKVNHQWERVTATPELESVRKRRVANETVMKSQIVADICKGMGIELTRRQASKFKAGRGRVFRFSRGLRLRDFNLKVV